MAYAKYHDDKCELKTVVDRYIECKCEDRFKKANPIYKFKDLVRVNKNFFFFGVTK